MIVDQDKIEIGTTDISHSFRLFEPMDIGWL